MNDKNAGRADKMSEVLEILPNGKVTACPIDPNEPKMNYKKLFCVERKNHL